MVRLTDRPDMTLDVYRGRKTTKQQVKLYVVPISQCIFDFEIRKKQMFTEARAFSRVTYFLFSGEPAGFFLKLT